MTPVIETEQLRMSYGGKPALRACTMAIPAGHVVGLVGPNGAGKSTLLNLAVGLLAPTGGTVTAFGRPPASVRARIGFVAQDAPVYATLSVAEHLTLGARLNPAWDAAYADARIQRLGLDRRQRAGRLSGGQRAQLALTLALAKRPDLLLLDEPVAGLDPLARRDFLDDLTRAVAARDLSVVLSSHLVPDLERICDYLIVLDGGLVRMAGRITDLLAAEPGGTGLEDLVLATMTRNRHTGKDNTA